MKRIISLLIALSVLVGCMLSLASCGAPEDAGAEISVYLGEEIYDFDPTDYYVDSNADQVMGLLFEPLFNLNKNGNIENAMASGYSVDRNERKITIQLRESYWSDEIRVTAADFIYSWRNLILEPNNARPASALLYGIENALELKNGLVSTYEFGAVASDIYEITITYREGYDYNRLLKNLASIATSPVRQDIVTQSTEGYWTKVMNTAITNGPFRLDTVDYEENSFTLARNLGYHQPPATVNYTKQVIPNKLVSFFTGNKALELTYQDVADKAVFYMGDATLADRAENSDKAKLADDLSTYTYVFNTQNPLFAIKEVRQALSMAIDRNAIVEAISFGKAATGFIPEICIDPATNKTFRTEELIVTSAKVSEAKELLKGVNFAGINKTFSLTVDDNEEALAIANIVKAAWEELGFKVNIKKAGVVTNEIFEFSNNEQIKIKDSELQTIVKEASRGNRDFDVIGIDWQMYSTDPFVALSAFSLTHSGCGVDLPAGTTKYGSIGGFHDAAIDEAITAAYANSDSNVISDSLHNAEKILLDSAYVVPLVFNQSFAFVSSELSGVNANGLGNFVFTKVSQKNYREYLY